MRFKGVVPGEELTQFGRIIPLGHFLRGTPSLPTTVLRTHSQALESVYRLDGPDGFLSAGSACEPH